jgi:hypothetical protein
VAVPGYEAVEVKVTPSDELQFSNVSFEKLAPSFVVALPVGLSPTVLHPGPERASLECPVDSPSLPEPATELVHATNIRVEAAQTEAMIARFMSVLSRGARPRPARPFCSRRAACRCRPFATKFPLEERCDLPRDRSRKEAAQLGRIALRDMGNGGASGRRFPLPLDAHWREKP